MLDKIIDNLLIRSSISIRCDKLVKYTLKRLNIKSVSISKESTISTYVFSTININIILGHIYMFISDIQIYIDTSLSDEEFSKSIECFIYLDLERVNTYVKIKDMLEELFNNYDINIVEGIKKSLKMIIFNDRLMSYVEIFTFKDYIIVNFTFAPSKLVKNGRFT